MALSTGQNRSGAHVFSESEANSYETAARAEEVGDPPLEPAAGDGHALARTCRAATKEATTRTVSTLQYRKPRTLVTSRFSAR